MIELKTEIMPMSVNSKTRSKSRNIYARNREQLKQEWLLQYNKKPIRKSSLRVVILTPTDSDIDNITKIILDSMIGIIYESDNQIFELYVKRCKGKILSIYIEKLKSLDNNEIMRFSPPIRTDMKTALKVREGW